MNDDRAEAVHGVAHAHVACPVDTPAPRGWSVDIFLTNCS